METWAQYFNRRYKAYTSPTLVAIRTQLRKLQKAYPKDNTNRTQLEVIHGILTQRGISPNQVSMKQSKV